MARRALEPPKLAAWSGWAALDPTAGVVVLVVVTPGASVTVVRDVSACWRTGAASNWPSARFTGAPKLRPPSVDTATIGRLGSAFGAVALGLLRLKLTTTTSSLPCLVSTTRPWAGRTFSAASPVFPRALYTRALSQVSPRLV